MTLLDAAGPLRSLARRLAGVLWSRMPGQRRQLARRLAAAEAALAEAQHRHHAFVEALGVAVYTTDAEGRLTSCNEAAVALWGHRPPLGDARWCGSWRLYRPDGTPLPHEECPMAVALREGRPVRGAEAVAERPDGSRVPFLPYPTPLRDRQGRVIGAVNLLVDTSGRRTAEAALAEREAHLSALVETTPECIKLVAPDGTLLQMNRAGLHMCQAGSPEEAEGRNILDLIAPEDREAWRHNHERVCCGESLSWEFGLISLRGARRHMETHAVPLRLPDGRLAQLAITRDVTQRKAAEERQRLLVREVDHRAKNVLAVALSMVRLTRADNAHSFAEAVEGRIAALAHAHTLLAREGWSGAGLRAIAERELAGGLESGRISLHGDPVALMPGAVQAVAVVLHELATNAVKHGALSAPEGHVTLSWKREAGGGLRIGWVERDGPSPAPPGRQGFGSKLIEATVRGQLGGSVLRQWEPEGLRCEVTIAANRLRWREGPAAPDAVEAGAKPDAADAGARPPPPPALAGRRILVAEDEPLVALELEAQLRALHCEVIGPAAMLEDALRLAASAPLDAAVLDINLAGRASFPVAELLTGREVPVIFATGYGELPAGGAGRRHLLLRKPLASGELEAALRQVLAKDGAQGRTHAPSGSLPAAEGEGTVSPRLRRGGGHALD